MNKKLLCHDCKKEAKVKDNEIKNGVMAVYEKDGREIEIFKCRECFSADKSLDNFQECEVYSRVVGYLRPVSQWHTGKQMEFKERKEYKT